MGRTRVIQTKPIVCESRPAMATSDQPIEYEMAGQDERTEEKIYGRENDGASVCVQLDRNWARRLTMSKNEQRASEVTCPPNQMTSP